jgi:hypothetical protein
MTSGGVAVPSMRPPASMSSPAASATPHATAIAVPLAVIRRRWSTGGSRTITERERDGATSAFRKPHAATLIAVRVPVSLTALLVLAGCGSRSVAELPPAAEPARAPALDAAPAGRIVAVGREPEGLAALPGRVAVGVREPAQLVLLDASSLRVRRRLSLPGPPRHLASDAVRRVFLVPAERADRYLEVGSEGAIRPDAPTGHWPHDAAAAGGRVFVGDERANTVSVIEGTRSRGRLPVATQPGGLSPAGDAVAVVSVRERVLELYDARTLRRTGRAPAGIGPTHVAAAGAWLYVVDTSAGALLAYRREPELELVRRVHLPGTPYGIALDPTRRRLW